MRVRLDQLQARVVEVVREEPLRTRPVPRPQGFQNRPVAYETRRVSSASNRIGLRTEGPSLERGLRGELPSEGMELEAVQVPPDGCPMVLLADHPTTGGYPVAAVVDERDLAAAAQAVPGTPVRFVPVRSARSTDYDSGAP